METPPRKRLRSGRVYDNHGNQSLPLSAVSFVEDSLPVQIETQTETESKPSAYGVYMERLSLALAHGDEGIGVIPANVLLFHASVYDFNESRLRSMTYLSNNLVPPVSLIAEKCDRLFVPKDADFNPRIVIYRTKRPLRLKLQEKGDMKSSDTFSQDQQCMKCDVDGLFNPVGEEEMRLSYCCNHQDDLLQIMDIYYIPRVSMRAFCPFFNFNYMLNVGGGYTHRHPAPGHYPDIADIVPAGMTARVNKQPNRVLALALVRQFMHAPDSMRFALFAMINTPRMRQHNMVLFSSNAPPVHVDSQPGLMKTGELYEEANERAAQAIVTLNVQRSGVLLFGLGALPQFNNVQACMEACWSFVLRVQHAGHISTLDDRAVEKIDVEPNVFTDQETADALNAAVPGALTPNPGFTQWHSVPGVDTREGGIMAFSISQSQ